MNKNLLLDNAYLSWTSAIKYCKEIKNGNASLKNKKNFVTSLHNATELFFKQLMLNQNDYRVAEVRGNRNDKYGEPLKSFYNAPDLNEYFSLLSDEDMKKFKTIEFSQMIEICKQILKSYTLQISKDVITDITDALKKLNLLRNTETHFMIDKNEFLTETEYVSLHNFMIILYDVLKHYDNLLPFWGEPSRAHKHYVFEEDELSTFSYVDAIKNSKYIKDTYNFINGEVFYAEYNCAYETAEYLYTANDSLQKYTNFDTFLDYINVLYDYDFVYFETIDYFENDESDEYLYSIYNIRLKI